MYIFINNNIPYLQTISKRYVDKNAVPFVRPVQIYEQFNTSLEFET